jgi:hypothetical protein
MVDGEAESGEVVASVIEAEEQRGTIEGSSLLEREGRNQKHQGRWGKTKGEAKGKEGGEEGGKNLIPRPPEQPQ